MRRRRLLAGLAALMFPCSLSAQEPPRFAQPVDCTLGDSCYVQNYPDTLSAAGRAADFACGALTYDAHKGTDFALPTHADMARGVDVLAAADGTVVAARDGVPDTGIGDETAGKECGNGVVIDHGAGWVSQYCHLKNGSVAVRPRTEVKEGTALGQVGFSGKTAFPHVHFAVRHNGSVIDPFDPAETARCGISSDTLWQEAPAYVAGGVTAAGFSEAVPGFEEVKAGTSIHSSLPHDAEALVLWALLFGVKQSDILELRISGPSGFSFTHRAELNRTQALAYRAAGKRAPTGGWSRGRYVGTLTLIRGGAPISSKTTVVEIGD